MCGGSVSITAGVLIFLLFCSELSSYMTTTVKDHVVVDPTIGIKMRLNFNITFHALTCAGACAAAPSPHIDATLTPTRACGGWCQRPT